MKLTSRCIWVVAMICGLVVLSSCQPTLKAGDNQPEVSPLKITQPNEEIIQELDSFILSEMRTSNVPGLAVALIRDNELVWEKGYGVSNMLSQKPVTAETVFNVASNGKAIAAYTALSMVESGQMALDIPMENYFDEPWLPPEPYGSHVTLRHILSHTSGLSNNTSGRDREIAFPPGDEFSYSGAGFRYLQETIEQVTGEAINLVIEQTTLLPLGMTSSSYASRDDLEDRTATGHISALSLIGIFSLPFLAFYVSLIVAAGVLTRIYAGKWVPHKRFIVFLGIVAAALPAIIAAGMFGFYTARFIRTASLYGIVFWVIFLAIFHLISRIAARTSNRRQRLIRTVLPMIAIAAVLGVIANLTPAPLYPRRYSHGNIAFTFRSTAGDLARFLIEISEPRVMPPEISVLIQEPQIKINEHISWGLGMGIQHSTEGDSLWHWGANTGFHSIMIMYPQHDIGVVVLTNSNDGLILARDIAQFALGGLNEWDISPD